MLAPGGTPAAAAPASPPAADVDSSGGGGGRLGGGRVATARTRGTVVDEDGRPVPGAAVSGRGDLDDDIGPGTSATTDAEGRFEIVVLDDDIATFHVSAPGFIERTISRQTRDASGVVLRRENRSRVRIHLTGDVVAGDSFRVVRADGDMRLSPARGSFTLPPEVLETWSHELPRVPVVDRILELPDRLEPGVTRLLLLGERGSAGPQWVHVPPHGGTLDLVMEVRPRTRLEVLVSRDGLPASGGYAILSAGGIDVPIAWVSTWDSGRAVLTCLDVPGRTLWLADAGTRPVPDRATRIEIELEPQPQAEVGLFDASEFTSFVPPDGSPPGAPGSLRGRIRSDAWPPLETGFVLAIERTAHPARWRFFPTAALGTSPTFSFKSLLPGRYLLVLRCGALVAASDGPVEVRPGETTDVGALSLRRGAVLSGRVVDAAGAPRPFTRVEVTDEHGALIFTAWTDPDGGYRVEGLWSGVFRATVGSEGEPGFVRAEVRVAGSAEHRLDLRPAPPR